MNFKIHLSNQINLHKAKRSIQRPFKKVYTQTQAKIQQIANSEIVDNNLTRANTFWVATQVFAHNKLAKIKRFIASPIEYTKYKKITGAANKELITMLDGKDEILYKRANPITNGNISYFKLLLKNYLERNGINLSDKKVKAMLNENNPNELLRQIKNSGKAIAQESAFLKAFTPKSKTQEVLQIESELRKLGIKEVNFSDDYDWAQIAKEAIIDLKKTTIVRLPESITVTPLLQEGALGMCNHNIKSTEIFLAPYSIIANHKNFFDQLELRTCQSKAFKNAPKNIQKKMSKAFVRKACSTDLMSHVFLHEIGHSIPYKKTRMTYKDLKAGAKLSRAATREMSGEEIFPELFACLMAGVEPPKRLLSKYIKSGGKLVYRNSQLTLDM